MKMKMKKSFFDYTFFCLISPIFSGEEGERGKSNEMKLINVMSVDLFCLPLIHYSVLRCNCTHRMETA